MCKGYIERVKRGKRIFKVTRGFYNTSIGYLRGESKIKEKRTAYRVPPTILKKLEEID
jgi:hypothetical protein